MATAAQFNPHPLDDDPEPSARVNSGPPLVDPGPRLGAEKRLMLAVLQGALRDFQTYALVPRGRGRRIFDDAESWFRAEGGGPFGFETICDAVGLDPDFIRDGLSRWRREQRLRPVAPAPLLRFVRNRVLESPPERDRSAAAMRVA